MSVKILASAITSLDTFSRDPETALKSGDRGVITVLDNNMPIFTLLRRKEWPSC